MNDFIAFDLKSRLNEEQIFRILARDLPAFAWRRGASDAAGAYISGMNSDSVQIKIWLDEDPIAMSLSFRGAWLDAPDKESRIRTFTDQVTTIVVPSIGQVVKTTAKAAISSKEAKSEKN